MTAGSLANEIVTISKSPYSIEMGTGKLAVSVTEDSKNDISQVTKPKSKSNWSQAPENKQYDFKRITATFTIEGFLEDDGTLTALQKSYQLESMFRAGGNVGFTWSKSPRTGGSYTYSVTCTSWRFQHIAGLTEAMKFTCVLVEGIT